MAGLKGKNVVYRQDVFEFIENGVKTHPDPDSKAFLSGDTEYSANELLAEVREKTPEGLRLYRSAVRLLNSLVKSGTYTIEGSAQIDRERVDTKTRESIEDIGAVHPTEHTLSFNTSYRFAIKSKDGLIHPDTQVGLLDGGASPIATYPASQLKIDSCRISGFSYM